jgi:hypothetical protein
VVLMPNEAMTIMSVGTAKDNRHDGNSAQGIKQ